MDEFITGVDSYLASGLLPYYYLLVFISGLFLLFKYRFRIYPIFIVLLFWEGFFVYAGNSFSSTIYEFYKIFIVLFALVIFGGDFLNNLTRRFSLINTLFLLYTTVVIISMLINNQPILTSLSQYGKKYLLIFLVFHGLNSKRITRSVLNYYIEIIFNVLIIQIFLSISKILILNFGESVVGSVAFIGGGLATTLPILGFLFIWQNANGKPKTKDWFVLFGFLIVAVASNKRAPIFILPLLSVAMYTYVYRTRNIVSFFKYIPLVLLILYIGIRSNPSLNPERSRWGSFDIAFATEYAADYMFGSERQLEVNDDIAYGRGGSFVALFTPDPYNVPIKNMFFGQGVTEILKNYEEFDNMQFRVSSKGALNGAMLKYISYGILGMILHFLLGISYIAHIKQNNFTNILLLFFIGDFVFYDGVIFENGAMALIVFLLVNNIYSINYALQKKNSYY